MFEFDLKLPPLHCTHLCPVWRKCGHSVGLPWQQNVKGYCGSGQCSAPWPALMTASGRGRGHACTSCPGRGWGGVSVETRGRMSSVLRCEDVRRRGGEEATVPSQGQKCDLEWQLVAAGPGSGDPNPALLPAPATTGHPATLPEPMINNIWENRQPRRKARKF